MNRFIKKPLKERLKDTAFLLKNTFTVVGKDKDIKTPTKHMIILSIINTTLFFGALLTFFTGTLVGLGILLLMACIGLFIFSFFYNARQKADQSWIVYNTITGKDISYTDAHNHTKNEKGKLKTIGFVDLVMKYVGSQKDNKSGIGGFLINLFLSFLIEVWDLLSHYMYPAVVIEQKSLKESVPKIKSLKDNVPSNLVGVFGIDFVGNVANLLLIPIYILFLAISVGIGYLIALSTDVAVWTIGSFSFSWIPVIVIVYLVLVAGSSVKKIIESIKVIYFTIFYTSITRPMEIKGDMKEELTNYLKMSKSDFEEPKKQTPQQKYISKLAEYIKKYREKGKSDSEIKEFLLSKGYPAKDINSAIKKSK